MKVFSRLALAAAVASITFPALASDTDARIDALSRQLEAVQAELKAMKAEQKLEKESQIAKLKTQKTSAGPSAEWLDRIGFEGEIQVQSSYIDVDKDDAWSKDANSDLILKEVVLGVSAEINENTEAYFNLKYEEGDDGEGDINLDEGFIVFSNLAGVSDLSLKTGQFIVPFGVFNTNLLDDPLLKELSEIRDSAIMLSYDLGSFNMASYVYRGEADNKDEVASWGLSSRYSNDDFTVGLDYTNNILNTDGLYESFVVNDPVHALDPEVTDVKDEAPAFIFYANANFGNLSLTGEFLQSDDVEIVGGDKFEIEALQLEAAYDFDIVTLGVAYQETENLGGNQLGTGQPEERVTFYGVKNLNDNTTLQFEIYEDEDYSLADGGSGEDAKGANVRLTLGF